MRNPTIAALLGFVLFGCADTAPPTWPGEGELTASESSADGVTLSWPAASDDNHVAHYRVLQEDDEIATVSGSTLEYRVSRLDDATEYRFGVLAIDDSQNESGRLYLTLTTHDGTPPGWNRGARLMVEALEAGEGEDPKVQLRWGGGNDNIGIAGFRLRRDGHMVVELGAEVYEHTLEGGAEGIDLVAFDEAGNVSVPLAASPGEVAEVAPPAEPTEPPGTLNSAQLPSSAAIREQLQRATPRLQINRPLIRPQVQQRFQLDPTMR